MTTNGLSIMSDQLSLDQVKKEGCLLWAKIRGYSYWPGIVTVDPMDGLTISESSKTAKVHVHFLGYSNMRGWVEVSNCIQYEGKTSYDQLAAKCPKSRQKDFFPTKKYQRLFEKAAEKAEEVMKIPQEKRLKSLGLIYVLVEDESAKASSNGVSTPTATPLPKITTGVGFFKSYQPPPEPAKPLEKTLDIFDFDDSEDIPSSPFVAPTAEKKSETDKTEVVKSSSKPTPKLELQKTRKEKVIKRKSSPSTPKAPSSSSSVKMAKKSSNSGPPPPKKVKVSSMNDENDKTSVMIEDLKESDEFDDNPNLGSLVWGRMSGFPYWPCFVTKSPVSGETTRKYKKREESHAQFFNWNNESGWIQSVLPWCSMNEYHSRAKIACPKGATSAEFRNWYPPARLLARWKGAIAQAQKTENMSRKERHNSLVVNYAAANRGKQAARKAPTTSKATKRIQKPEEDDAKPTLTTTEEDVKAVDKACPAKKKNIVFKNGLSLGKCEEPV